MADYFQSTGATGTMMLRDTGYTIEFWLNSGSSSTWFGSGTFYWSSPHGSGSWVAGYSQGNGWQLMGSIDVSVNGDVGWAIPDTGTSGLGGPTTQVVYIQRAVIPSAPTMLGIDQLTHQSFRVRFSGNADGGSPILEWQIGFGLDPNNVQGTTGSGGTTVINTSYAPGSTVYAWARGRNAVGWSSWSARASGVLLPGVRLRVSGAWKHAIPYVRRGGVWVPMIPYVRKNGVWVRTNI